MAESVEEFEPLFDYTRVQPADLICLDDDFSDFTPEVLPKRRKADCNPVEKKPQNENVINVDDCDDNDELDWLPPPPKVSIDTKVSHEDSVIKELRLKKQELVSFAQSAKDLLRTVEESMKRDVSTTTDADAGEIVAEKPSKSLPEREKIVISIQDKDGLKQFRVYMDDMFERLLKSYAEKANLDAQRLVFCFDGDKINLSTTPRSLGMEDEDIIEVHVK